MDRWEKQADRHDAILDAQERQLGIKRAGKGNKASNSAGVSD